MDEALRGGAGGRGPEESGWRDLLRGRGRMARARFAWWGLGLAALKWNIDRLLLGWMSEGWSTREGNPLVQAGRMARLYLWQAMPEGLDTEALGVLLAASIPFLYVGVMLTLARLRSARMSGWWVLLFLVPVVKLFFFGLLCVVPGRGGGEVGEKAGAGAGTGGRGGRRWGGWMPRSGAGVSGLAGAGYAVAVVALMAAAATWVGAQRLQTYGWALFVGSPFAMGFVATWICSGSRGATLMRCLGVTWGAMLAGGIALLAFAFEGVVCLVMAAPLAMALGSVGSLTAWAVRRSWGMQPGGTGPPTMALALIPLGMGLEHWLPVASPVRPVRTVLEVDAVPAVVWRHVVSFSRLPEPTQWMFRVGLAYPVRAEMHGTGVGAVRLCHFSTGPFVEPITAWDEPRRLAFRVESNPEPMQEWTPYRAIHPPHLEGHFLSRAGEFLLEPLPGGRTRLVGTTWYEHGLWPDVYWRAWSDGIIHSIHGLVLRHVKALAEADAGR